MNDSDDSPACVSHANSCVDLRIEYLIELREEDGYGGGSSGDDDGGKGCPVNVRQHILSAYVSVMGARLSGSSAGMHATAAHLSATITCAFAAGTSAADESSGRQRVSCQAGRQARECCGCCCESSARNCGTRIDSASWMQSVCT